METGWIVLTTALLLVIAALAMYLLSLRAGLREVARELEDKLQTDTNTLISLSTGDRTVRALAAQMNTQLQALRRERLKLRHGDRELKTAVTNISHDLRTPLTAISGYLDLLEREPLSQKQCRYVSVLRERTDVMRTLTEELLRYSVITGGEDDLNLHPVCLNDILEQSLAGICGVLEGRGIVPQIHIPEEKIVRTLDKTALRRIYDNILTNAAKYSDGDLTVCLLPDGTAVFENRAASLDAVQAQRLFDRYYTVRSPGHGPGLGLSIARRLTQRMGGTVTATYAGARLCVRVQF